MTLNLQGIGGLTFESLTIEGRFTADGQQIVEGVLTGMMDVTSLTGACFLLNCSGCPSNPSNDCALFNAEDIVFNNNGLGGITPVP
jgi:hypothetical protein